MVWFLRDGILLPSLQQKVSICLSHSFFQIFIFIVLIFFQLIAIFDERIRHRPPNNGDGTSASSAGTASPDIFQGGTYDESYRLQPVASLHDSDAEKPAFVNGSINRKNVKDIRIEQEGMENFKKDKRWKSTELDFRNIEHEDTIGGLQKQRHSTSTSSTNSSPDISKKPRALGVGGFDRNLNRKSLNVNHPMLYSWIDAQDRMMDVKYSQVIQAKYFWML